MPSFEQDCIEMKVDVGVLKEQVKSLTQLCEKMDKVIDKLMDNNDRMVNQIYDDMDRRKESTTADIKELHSRITTVDRNLGDKLELTERRIMEEIKQLREDISKHNEDEDSKIDKILEWKWMAAGGILVLAWLISNIKFDILLKLFS
jgi:predicted RNase H-like nuclease (RuvC/YqgF family)